MMDGKGYGTGRVHKVPLFGLVRMSKFRLCGLGANRFAHTRSKTVSVYVKM